MKKGFFIVLEGPDRSGKSTQAAMLKEWLEQQGMQIILTREPGGTAISERIRKILLDPQVKAVPVAELFLFAVSRSQHNKTCTRSRKNRYFRQIHNVNRGISGIWQGSAGGSDTYSKPHSH